VDDRMSVQYIVDNGPLPVMVAAGVEWSLAMTHTGPLQVGAGETIAATGVRVTVNGVTIAEFRDHRICALRQYWNEFAVLEQIGVSTVDRPG